MQNISLKAKKQDHHANDMFISEFEKEESLSNLIPEIYKNRHVKN